MLTRRRFLGYSALGAGAMAPSGWLARRPQSSSEESQPQLPPPEISARAQEVHKRALVFDGHVHATDREFYQGGSMGTRKTNGYWDLVRAREGGVGAFFLSVYIPEEYYPSRFETKQALRRIEHALEQLEINRDQVALALTADDLVRIRASGKMAAVLDVEGSYDLDGDLGVLHDLYRLGVRSTMLSAHNWPQHYADACCSPPQVHGLTAQGREVVHEINRLGMVLNVSHASDDSTSQAIDASSGPIIATHEGLRSLNDIPRNMPDWLMKKLTGRGGIFGFQIGNEFHSPTEYAYQTAHAQKPFWDTANVPQEVAGLTIYQVDKLVEPQFPRVGVPVPQSVRMTADEWVAVVDRGIQLVGEDYVALGSDFDGGPNLMRGMRDVRDLAMITDAMLRRGYSEERIDRFWGGNLLRFFGQVTQKRA